MDRINQTGPNPIAFPAAVTASALMLVCALLLTGAVSNATGTPGAGRAADAQQPASVRIGTYDSRAVAVAYARSAQLADKLKDLQRQRSEAEKAADKKRVEQLDAQGESMQIRMHLQGFSNAPIDDVLEIVRDRLAGVAQQKNVMAIACVADYHDPSVELVDVTDELVQLFNPDAQTLKIVSQVRAQKPLAIEVVAKMPAKS